MRILLINDNGIEVGGAETYLLNLKKGLIAAGHEVKIMTSDHGVIPDKTQHDPGSSNKSFSDYTFKGLNTKSPFRVFPYVFNPSSLSTLRKVIKEFKPDIVHLHFIFYHTSPSVLLALKHIPTVMTLHAHELLAPVGIDMTAQCHHDYFSYCVHCAGKSKYPAEVLKRALFRAWSGCVKTYITPSRYYKKLYESRGFTHVTQLYNGIVLPETYKKPDNKTHNILYVGRLAPEKGAQFAVRAMSYILKEYPGAQLTIVGDGQHMKYLKVLSEELGCEKQIVFSGKVPNEKTGTYYDDANVVVVPSTYPDNLPTVCIEAMLHGRPVIVSDIGGLPEMVENGYNGYTVPPADEKKLAEKVIEVLENKKNIDYADNAFHYAHKFDIGFHIAGIEEIYKQALSSRT